MTFEKKFEHYLSRIGRIRGQNIMDDEPFLSFNVFDPLIYISSLKQFCKEEFDIGNVISKAFFQKCGPFSQYLKTYRMS